MNPIKIAITGKANSGKNTLASMIYSEMNDTSVQVRFMAFADPIKEMVMLMYPQADRNCLYGASQLRAQQIPNTNITYRQVLLDLGKIGRSYDPNLWVNNFISRYDSLVKASLQRMIIAVPDVRFLNEARVLKSNGFFMIKLLREQNALKINDISETEQDSIPQSDFNAIIFNNKGISHLKNEIIKKVMPHII